ncbi:type II toxin-antitoxin system RelE/ParE family toxin [bacterium]|nr:type II toxin-antitoxin system RelE/ParE family toxin [bacterium]
MLLDNWYVIEYHAGIKEVIYYTTKDGKCPFQEWLNKLDSIEQKRIRQRLLRVQLGNFGDCKPLQNSELSELRFITNKGYRVYYKELDNIIVLILAGSDKSNQTQTITKANKYFDEFKERYYTTG